MRQKKQLLERINSLSSTEHEEIFNILQRLPAINFTSNKNGVFFNLSTLNDDAIDEIDRFVSFCLSNRQDLDEYDKRLNECKANSSVINIDLETIVERKQASGKKVSALPICDWASVNIDQVVDAKNTQQIINFIERITCEKGGKKKINVKFHNAKKKYAKRILSDSKFECDFVNELLPEDYLLKA